jgi:hypothetical protein
MAQDDFIKKMIENDRRRFSDERKLREYISPAFKDRTANFHPEMDPDDAIKLERNNADKKIMELKNKPNRTPNEETLLEQWLESAEGLAPAEIIPFPKKK